MAESVGHLIQDITGGRPFVFMIMAYNAHWDLYRGIKSLVKAETGLECIRADDVRGSGHDLLQKIHLLIERAELVIAELSTASENVFYEVGYALGKNKPLLLLAETDRNIPTDLKGRELIRRGQTRTEGEQFEREFREHLRTRLGSRFALLRDMLLGDTPTPSYIVASPRYPSEVSQIPGQRFDTRTFGDNTGIRGLLQAFGAIIGEGAGVELVSAQFCHPGLVSPSFRPPGLLGEPVGEPVSGPVNLYLIGSKKVNPPAGFMLERIQARYPREATRWYLGKIPKDPETQQYLPNASKENVERDNYRCRLYEMTGDCCVKWQGDLFKGNEVHSTDYGIVVRSLHPETGRLVVILAGAHSLGTCAACLAATRSSKIQQIRETLPSRHDFEDKKHAFWALLRGTACQDGMLDETGVEVVKADWYDP